MKFSTLFRSSPLEKKKLFLFFYCLAREYFPNGNLEAFVLKQFVFFFFV